MTFTIKRSKWWRGRRAAGSGLLRLDGQQCCIGQVCSQLGVTDDQMRDTGTVDGLSRDAPKELVDDRFYERFWVGAAYEINDDENITDTEREDKLTALARANGHDFVFVD